MHPSPSEKDSLAERQEIARRVLAAAEAAARTRRASPPGELSDSTGSARHDADPSETGSDDSSTRRSTSSDKGLSPEENARRIALRQLTMAPRTRAQLEQSLIRRGCDEEAIRQVLDRFQEVGLIDDEAYAGMLVRSQRASRGLARRALRGELRKKGVPDELAESALAEVSEADEQDEARRIVAKRLRTMHGLPRETQARRLAGALARKGYSGEIAYCVIRQALDELPEHRRD
ncbi:regulatory protein [Austwickia chelonae]|nr:regulatory protein [Austwickia chelonae]